MAKIQADTTYKACGLTVKVKKIPFGTKWNKDCPGEGFKKGDLYKADRLLSGGTGKIGGITIHNTDDRADAATYTLATFNQNMNSARVHFYVDDKEAWQNLELNEVGWHAGTGNYGKGNDDTVAIEIIMGKRVDFTTDGKDRRAFINGAILTAYILKIAGLGTDKVFTHKKWNGKNCPLYILPDWEIFIGCVEYLLCKMTETANDFCSEKDVICYLSGDTEKCELPILQKDGNIPDSYAEKAIAKATEKGYLLGDTQGNLRLHDALTRQDLFVILDRIGLIG